MSNLLVPVDSSLMKCGICGKDFEKDVIIVKDGDLCPECRKTYSNLVILYCNKCKRIVARAEPGFVSEGFFAKPGDVLHVNECPICHPGIVRSIPVEMQEHEKGR